MKEKLLNNLGYKALSVIAAFFLWLIIVNVDDYTVTKQINGIKVQVENASAITEQGKVYSMSDGQTVDIIVKGRRTVVETLSADDFNAVADLSKLSMTNAVQIKVNAKSKAINQAISINCINDMLTVELENLIEKPFPVSVVTQGQAADGYMIGGKIAAPNLITVAGAESVVNSIESVKVEVEVAGNSEDIVCDVTPVFLDKNNEPIDSSDLTLSSNKIGVNVRILKTKAVDIDLKTVGKVADGYELYSMTYLPETVSIAGDESALKKISTIKIDDVDISGITEDEELTIDLEKYLPDGIIPAADSEQIMVQVIVKKIITNVLKINTSDIELANKKDNYTYSVAFHKVDGNSVDVKVKGTATSLADVSKTSLHPTVDVGSFEEGTYYRQVAFADIDGVTVMTHITVAITVKEKK